MANFVASQADQGMSAALRGQFDVANDKYARLQEVHKSTSDELVQLRGENTTFIARVLQLGNELHRVKKEACFYMKIADDVTVVFKSLG